MTLTAAHIKRVIERYHEGLLLHRDALNRLNVYPVPDGDTGTNMTLTVTAVIDAFHGAETMAEVAEAMSHGSLMGARGNSGVILSQILRGFADTFKACDGVGTNELIEALTRASDAAYESVVRPVEGTILTVAREAAMGARESGPVTGDDLGIMLNQVYVRALGALESTPDLLPVLKQAGVVDAGGAGLLLLIAAFVEETTGEARALPDGIVRAANERSLIEASASAVADLRYEVMFFLEASETAVGPFRRSWAEVGDSIVVVGGDGTYNCHIHTDDIGASIEAGIAAGRPYDIRVTDLLEQRADASHHRFEPLADFADAALGVVAVAAGQGLVDMFRDFGAQAVVAGGQSMNPSTEDLLSEVDRMAADTVIVLPNNKNIIPVANRLGSLSTKDIRVIPTKSVPQGIAAMVSYMPGGSPDVVVTAMLTASEEIVSGEVTRAVRDAQTDAGPVREGEWLVIVDGAIVATTGEEADALRSVITNAVGPGTELATLILGDGHDPAAVAELAQFVAQEFPGVELETVDGGQPLYPYLVSVE